MDVMTDRVVGAVVQAQDHAALAKGIAMLILTALAIWNVALTIVTWAWDLRLDMIVAIEVRTIKIVSFLDIVCCSAQKITDIWNKNTYILFIILHRLLSCKWSCCTSTNQCGIGEGDCDVDSHCSENLKCGTDNCDTTLGFPSAYDCCYDPATTQGNTALTLSNFITYISDSLVIILSWSNRSKLRCHK